MKIQILKLFVEKYALVNGEIGNLIDQKWIDFSTTNEDPLEIEQELNFAHRNEPVTYNVVAIK